MIAPMELLKVSDIAKRLEIPESTVRYYRDRFPQFVPAVGEGRSKRYRPEALAVLRFIAESLRSGLPAEEVETALWARFPVTVEPQQQSAAAQQQTAVTPQQASAAILRELLVEAVQAAAEAQTAALRSEMEARHAAAMEQQTALYQQVGELAATLQQERSEAQQFRSEAQQRHDALLGAIQQDQERRPWWRLLWPW